MIRLSLPRWLRRLAWLLLALVVVALGILLGRAFEARGKPELMPWHRLVLAAEVHADSLPAQARWADYRAREQRLFDELRSALAAAPVSGRLRYEVDSHIGPAAAARDWNRSFESTPPAPRGGVLLLHGLTDAPYSVRGLATLYEQAGFAVIAPRLPGHGTIPAGLLDVRWQDWRAVVALAMRELRARVGPDRPLHILGYSNGGALALDYTLDALDADGDALPRPQQLVLVSPMIGLRPYAGLSRWLPLFGGIEYFEKSRWLDILPEFNPFKYNSFPVNGAVQSYLLTTRLQARLLALASSGRNQRLPPILGFQSVLDGTVSSHAVVHSLFEMLPANGSALVLFDINRASLLADMFKVDAANALDVLHDDRPQTYRVDVLGNADPATLALVERRYDAGARDAVVRPLQLAFPPEVYSLSHVALPFACDDPLYGMEPRMDEDFGIRLGTLRLRGERGALVVAADQFSRLGCNPFHAYLRERIAQTLPPPPASGAGAAPSP